MLAEFREYLMSQNKPQNIVESYIQSVQEYITWFSPNGKELTQLSEQNIDESVSYTIFEGTHNICL